MSRVADPYKLTAAEIQRLMTPGTVCFPELEAARRDVAAFARLPHVQALLERTQFHGHDITVMRRDFDLIGLPSHDLDP